MTGFGILCLMVFGTLSLGGKIGIYLDIPSLVMVVGVVFGGGLMCFSWNQLADAFEAALKGDRAKRVPARQHQTRVAVFARLSLLSWGGGLTAALIGVIAMLSDLSDPHSIGAGLAVALIAPLYGAALAELIFGPLQQTVMNQLPLSDGPDAQAGNAADSPVSPAGQASLWKGATIMMMVLGAMSVLISTVAGLNSANASEPVGTEVLPQVMPEVTDEAAPQPQANSQLIAPEESH